MDGSLSAEQAIDAAALQQALQADCPRPLQVLHFAETDSTNRQCQQRLAGSGDSEQLWVVCADRQTAGRGRRGRHWHSGSRDNLYCSLGLVKTMPSSRLGLLPLLAGVVLAERLRSLGFDAVGLKWPNDLLAGGGKLGGILIENQPLGADRYALTIGFGLNLRLDDAALAAIGQPATSLHRLGPLPPRAGLLQDLLRALIAEYLAFEAGDGERLRRRFAALDVCAGRPVLLIEGAREIHGRCLGVDESGRLRAEIAGEERRFSAAEISLRALTGGGHAAA